MEENLHLAGLQTNLQRVGEEPRRPQVKKEEVGVQWRNRGRGRVYRGRASLMNSRILQEVIRGRGEKCRGRAIIRRREDFSRGSTAVAVKDAAVAPIIQDTHRGRGRSAAVAACAFSEISGFPSEDHILV